MPSNMDGFHPYDRGSERRVTAHHDSARFNRVPRMHEITKEDECRLHANGKDNESRPTMEIFCPIVDGCYWSVRRGRQHMKKLQPWKRAPYPAPAITLLRAVRRPRPLRSRGGIDAGCGAIFLSENGGVWREGEEGGAKMISFGSMGEAEGAMGRSLTYWEGLWYSGTHNVSDYKLYCMNIIFLFVIFNFAPLPYVLLDLWKVRSAEKYKVQPGVHNEAAETWKCYKTVMWTFFTVVGPLQLCSFPAVKFVGIRFGLPLPSLWEVFFQLLVYTTVEDYGNYWLHRWLHNGWWYDKIHSMHHEYAAPMSFAAPYAHWAEVLILGIPAFAGPAMAPGHIITFWIWIAMRQLEALDTHSGYDFPWNPTRLIPFYGGAEYHDYHHFVGGKSQSNFASVFTYCDWIYGTDKGYRYMKEVHKKEAIAKGKDQQQRENRWLQADDLKAVPASVAKDIKVS